MIEISNVEVVGWESAIRGMRNPLNSWSKSDSVFDYPYTEDVGANDLKLMRRLTMAGSDHAKYRRMITVYADIVAPLYWWKEYDTYKVGTVANSCSTMHKIQEKELTINDFSVDHLTHSSQCMLKDIIGTINWNRTKFLETKDKSYWWQMIQLLPSSYNQRRTVQLNYEVLANMYRSRKNHKLDEWRKFCIFIDQLPYSNLITNEES